MNNISCQFQKSFRLTLKFCILITLIFCQNYYGQKTLQNQNGCTYLEQDKPAIFISYEKETVEQNSKGQNVRQVLLRLHNNSSCEIIVEINDNLTGYESLYKKEIINKSNGEIITKFIASPPKDFELPISFDIQEAKDKSWKAANYWEDRHLIFTYPIPSGHSAVFGVSENYFKRRLLISVPFKYSWEDNSDLKTWGTISHRVSYVYELPKGFYKP